MMHWEKYPAALFRLCGLARPIDRLFLLCNRKTLPTHPARRNLHYLYAYRGDKLASTALACSLDGHFPSWFFQRLKQIIKYIASALGCAEKGGLHQTPILRTICAPVVAATGAWRLRKRASAARPTVVIGSSIKADYWHNNKNAQQSK